MFTDNFDFDAIREAIHHMSVCYEEACEAARIWAEHIKEALDKITVSLTVRNEMEDLANAIAEAIDRYKKLRESKRLRQTYLKRKDPRLDSYRYVKVFKRNMPYHRRHYQSCN